ncbi:MAG: ABC-F family ATP-binding cassette domain-containing protein [Erysipelotrichaceae bacterium]|nr:ABC-F family ATP-binding cassette domain-containing protein [Erysipelotrichaceae bacterium]
MLINAFNITIKYLDKVLFKDASFVINDTDKIGLLGINGAGKSTLIKAIIGDAELDSGIISKKKDLKIGYLPQESNFNELDTIFEAFNKCVKVEEFVAKSMLSKMGLSDYNRIVSTLSGGEKKRLGLSIALCEDVDLLILDEPTNHLDIWMINWLEKFLIKYNRGLLLVTHDRYFLERVTSKTMEIEHGNIYLYDANYSKFLDLKAERLLEKEAYERKLSALFKKEAAWAAMNPQARTTKSTERLARFKKLEEETRAIHAELVSSKELELSSVKTRMGKTTIEIENISKSIKGETLFKNFSYNVKKFDRLGIVGENGAGKTTLFKSILGLIPVDFGTITIGKTINIGYFAQEMPDFNKNIKMIDYLKSFGEYVETINGKLSASQMLENYLFPPSIQQQQLCRLSGGEKRRLQLLTVLMKNPNVLFLDEPTNDLDVYTLEILENYLESFMGAVIVVSHDRYFLDKVADHLLVLENNEIKEYNGIVSDYISQNPKVSIEKEKNKKEVLNIPRFTSQEKKEFDNIENVIEEIENKIKLLKEEQIVYSTDYQKLIELNEQIEELEILLLEKLERWEYLNNINEQIIEYRNNKYK